MPSREDLEEGLSVELAVFEGIEGGILCILVREAFDGDHAADLLLLGVVLEALVAVDADDLTKAKVRLSFLLFRHLNRLINDDYNGVRSSLLMSWG